MSKAMDFRIPRASRVLVSASRRNELSLKIPSPRTREAIGRVRERRRSSPARHGTSPSDWRTRATRALPNPPLAGRLVNLIAFVCFVHLQLSSTVHAGDILRGGSAASQTRGNVAGNATVAAVQAGAPNASDTLARTAQAL